MKSRMLFYAVLTVVVAGMMSCATAGETASPAGMLTLENRRFRLTVGRDARVRSLVVKATGAEMVAKGGALPLMTAEQPRPFHNEVKLIHPHKRIVYAANAFERRGDELTVGFEGEPFSAVFRLKLTDDYLALSFLRFEFDRKRGYGDLQIDCPPAVKLRALQLALAPRTYFGKWLNVVWDERNAAAVVSASPHPEVDHEEVEKTGGGGDGGGVVLFAELRKDVKMRNEPVALVVGAGREDFLDAMDALERDFDLPRGVESRRRAIINTSIYAAERFSPDSVDEVIATARRAGMRLVKVRYPSVVKELASWGACGDYDWRTDVWTNGEADLKAATAKLRAAGIVPGLHFLQTHVGLKSRYVTPVADPRLGKTSYFTLAEPIPEGTNVISELRVEERTCEVPAYAPMRILQFGGELLSYERTSDEPPYRFFGVRRGAHGTRPQAHPSGQIGGLLDISEYGTPGSCYVGQNSSLQDEVAARIARIYDCGFGFVYMDGSEGVQPPCGVNVGLAQYRVWRKLREKPLFAEGAAKSHFSWHILSGANAYDGPVPERFKDFLMRWQVVQAPLVAQDMTRCDFGWWNLALPGESFWWCEGGNDSSVGTQPDMWEFGEALSVAWSCPASCSGLDNWRQHPRGAELLEILRRWEDVRDRKLLTPGQVAKYRALRPGREVTLLVGSDGKYVWRDTEPLVLKDEPEGRRIRAFLFEENGRGVVQYWCADKPERGFILPADAPEFVWRDDYAGKACQPTKVPEGIRVTAANRGYLFFKASPDEVRHLMARAVCEDPAKGVDVAEVRRRVQAREAELQKDYAAKNAIYTDASHASSVREEARVAMLGILGDARRNWRELLEYAKGDERTEIEARLKRILETDMKLCE